MQGVIIAYRLFKNNSQKELNQFCKKFYGQETSSHKGKYRYRRRGLLDDIPHIILIRGVIIVSKGDAKKVVDFLKEYNAEVYVRDVTLLPEDEAALKKTPS
jgi:hypothetical protein